MSFHNKNINSIIKSVESKLKYNSRSTTDKFDSKLSIFSDLKTFSPIKDSL